MKRVLPILALFAFGTVSLPSYAAESSSAMASPCGKKHKKKRHGKKKASESPAKAPSSNI